VPELIDPEKLKALQDSNEDYYIIDTRSATDFDEWHIKQGLNYKFSSEDNLDRQKLLRFLSDNDINNDDSVITVCAKGKTSLDFAEVLEDIGYSDVYTLEGGMEAWSGVYDTVPIATTESDLIILQLQRRAKGCLGYLVGSKSTGEAAAIDVSRYFKKFISAASDYGFKIVHVLDTHIHADHISGGRVLADKLNTPYYLGSEAIKRSPDFDFTPLEDNEVINVGNRHVKAVHTPGHTSEMTSYLVDGEGIVTGDSLFIDSIGRTELEFSHEEARMGASLQYRSLSNRLLSLPETTKVLPSHFSVGEDGETGKIVPGTPIFSTIGRLRTENSALQLNEEDFIDYMFDNLPSKPPNYEDIIALNLGRRELTDEQEAIELELGPNRCASG